VFFMNSMNYISVFELQEQAFHDEYYQMLCKEFEQAQKGFESILQKLPDNQQADIGTYLEISQKMHFYLMALACDR